MASKDTEKHSLQVTKECDKKGKTVRRRCIYCYSAKKAALGRLAGGNTCRRVTTYCTVCEGNPAMCLNCFQKAH